jgi:hypothetical protein
MNPNSALSAWQLAIMAVVPVAALVAWLGAIFLAARASAASPAGAATAGTTSMHVVPTPVTGKDEPVPPADRIAA